MFDKKKIKSKSRNSRTFKQTKYSKKRNKKSFFIIKWILFLLISFFIFFLILLLVIYKKYIVPLPPVEDIKNMHIAQTSIIYDKNGNELYKIFKENRTYVDYENISKNMVEALVAGEDQRFWTNPGFDLIGITRAIIYGFFSGDFKGTSGLSQQLMKVTYLTSDRTMERKVKEFYLSWKLNKIFDKQKIVELYLNKIFFGSNAYGIEQASKTFFGINSSDLDILQSSILASLPKAPSGLSPYSNKDKLLGYPLIFNIKDSEHITKILNKKGLEDNKIFLSKLVSLIDNIDFSQVNDIVLLCNIDKSNIKSGSFRVDSDGCLTIGFEQLLSFLNSIKIQDGDYVLEYQTGRKDYILGRMLEDGYINFDTYKKAIIDSFGFEFNRYRTNIENPYFVMYVKDYLEKKYGSEIVEQGGLRIFTTLDSRLQDKAKELVEKYGEANEINFAAKNSAMISIDNKSGGIVAMVGGRDYFDEENGGNNNMITSRLQPGSTFKPFAYALAIENNQIGSKTPVYDLKTKFPGNYIPNNFDGEFKGKMDISSSLNTSRNIPAIKMFYLAGGEEKLISFMEKLGVNTLRLFKQEYKEKYPGRTYSYAAPMALGTGLMTPLELASAYSIFANMGVKKEINPIIRIVDRKGNIIEDRNKQESSANQDPVISPSLSYIMNDILSDTDSRPEFWNTYLSLPGRKFAAKTGTSTKQYTRNGDKIISPRNLWTIGYTPQYTTVAWAGNTNGKELNFKGNGLEAAGPIVRDFMEKAHIGEKAEVWPRPIGVKTINISNISGLLPSKDFPKNFLVESNFINSPEEIDNSVRFVEIDRICNGIVTPDTPKESIESGYLLKFNSLSPDNNSWELPVTDWFNSGEWKKYYGNLLNVITDYNNYTCKRDGKVDVLIKTSIENNELTVGRNDIQIGYASDRGIKRMEVFLGNDLIKTINTFNRLKRGFEVTIFVPFKSLGSNNILEVKLVDNQGYSYYEDIYVKIINRN